MFAGLAFRVKLRLLKCLFRFRRRLQPRQPSGAVTIFEEDSSGKVISFMTELPDGRKLTRRRVEK